MARHSCIQIIFFSIKRALDTVTQVTLVHAGCGQIHWAFKLAHLGIYSYFHNIRSYLELNGFEVI